MTYNHLILGICAVGLICGIAWMAWLEKTEEAKAIRDQTVRVNVATTNESKEKRDAFVRYSRALARDRLARFRRASLAYKSCFVLLKQV